MKRILVIVMSLIMVLTMIPAMATTAYGANGLTASLPTALSSRVYTGVDYDLQNLVDSGLLTVQYNGATLAKTDYQLNWTDPQGTACTAANAVGTYRGTITHTPATPAGSPQQTTTITFRIEKINMGIADFVVKYKGPTDMASYSAFATLKNGQDMGAMFDKSNLEIKQAGIVLDNSFFEAKATKSNDYQFSILLTSTNPNVWSSPKTTVVSLTTDFSAATFKIVGTAYNSDDIADVMYNGQELKPSVHVVPVGNAAGSKTGALALNRDYTLSYAGNINAADGVATVTATPKEGSRYGGTPITKTFNIKPKNINSVAINTPANSLNGEEPLFTVTDGANTLLRNTDYTLTSFGFVAGSTTQGELLITGSGNYTGTKTARYTIAQYSIASADVEQAATGVKTFTGAALYPITPRLKYMKGATSIYLNQNSDYVLEYRYDIAGVSYKTTNTPIDSKDYSVFALGRGQYGGSLEVGTFTIAQVPFIENSGVKISVTRGPSQNKPTVTVTTLAGVALKEGKDYTFTEILYIKETGKGSVKITSTGTGNLTAGTIYKEYTVASKQLPPAYFYEYVYGTGYTTSYSKSVQWTGSNLTLPTIRVMDGSSLLREGEHYDVTVRNSLGHIVTSIRDTGAYTVTVTGKGMYMGSQVLTYTVKGVDLSKYVVTLNKTTDKATGNNVSLPTVVSVKDGYKTLSSADYSVSYLGTDGKACSYARLAGEYTVVVTGKGGYEGTAKATFKLTGETQSVTTRYTRYNRYPNGKSFNVNASTETGGKITYTSSDKDIATVDAYGNVTVGSKVGVVTITVKAEAFGKYEAGVKEVTLTVKPNKGVIRKVTSPSKGQVRVWFTKQSGVERYQICVSKSSKFSSGNRYLRVNDKPQYKISQSGRIRNLSSGTYYVRIRRGYTNANGNLAYGNWSVVKTIYVR